MIHLVLVWPQCIILRLLVFVLLWPGLHDSSVSASFTVCSVIHRRFTDLLATSSSIHRGLITQPVQPFSFFNQLSITSSRYGFGSLIPRGYNTQCVHNPFEYFLTIFHLSLSNIPLLLWFTYSLPISIFNDIITQRGSHDGPNKTMCRLSTACQSRKLPVRPKEICHQTFSNIYYAFVVSQQIPTSAEIIQGKLIKD